MKPKNFLSRTALRIVLFSVPLSLFFVLYSFLAAEITINTANLKKHIEFLANDKLKGRGTGTQEELTAANYIAKQFKKLKLIPKGNLNSYFYSFKFKKPKSLHDTVGTGPLLNALNVAAFLDNGAENTIVIGAHFDHLGTGHDHNSMETNPEGKIHNGADDNASGVAGVLELARYFTLNKLKEKNNFLFICFSGEELGLLGSKKFTEDPTIDLSKTNYMINLDMIGRLNDTTKKVVVYGVGTAPEFVSLLDNVKTPLSIKKDSAGIGPSDQTSFYLKNIPVLHFFTGQHADYHRPSDDIQKINYPGEKMVLELVIEVMKELDQKPKLQFLKTRNTTETKSPFKVSLGIMPDYTFDGKGVKVDGVTEGKPAFIAGMQKGDIITQIDDLPINGMKDYMKALGSYKEGDVAKIIVDRKGSSVELKVIFQKK